jgi:hypothetical protein
MEEVTVEQSASRSAPRVSQSPARNRVREVATSAVLVKQVKQQMRAAVGRERAVPAVVRVRRVNQTREI